MPKKKPSKPRKDFPLYAHASGKWAKKIKGKLYYFGKWDDPHASLREYLERLPYITAGVPFKSGSRITVDDLNKAYLESLTSKRQGEVVGVRHLNDMRRTCRDFAEHVGGGRDIASLGPQDFTRIYKEISRSLSPVTVSNFVARVSSIFSWAYENQYLETPMRFGADFKRIPARLLRKMRSDRSKQLYSPEEVRSLIEVSNPPMNSFILLAINSGIGPTDISILCGDHFKEIDGTWWIDFPRTKTYVERRFPLMKETADSLKPIRAGRKLMFKTKYGKPWVRATESGSNINAISQEFTKIRKKSIVTRPGASFYDLRHTFETIAGDCKDQVAVKHIMGHADHSISAVYREEIQDDRLIAVVEHVRQWLFGD